MTLKKERFSKVARRLWRDAKFRALSPMAPSGQALFVWLITCAQQSNVPGVLAMGEAAIAEELGWPLEAFRKAFREVSAKGLATADWGARLVWIPNRIRHDPPTSPNVVLSWANNWEELPECDLKSEAYQSLRLFLEGKGEAWGKAFAKACPKPWRNQEQEQEQEQEQLSESRAHTHSTERAKPSAPPPTPPALADPRALAIFDALTVASGLPSTISAPDAAESFALRLLGVARDPGLPPECFAASVRDALAELPDSPTDAAARSKIRSFVKNTRRPGQRRYGGKAQPIIQSDSRSTAEVLRQTVATPQEHEHA